jgi:hypothetical protein
MATRIKKTKSIKSRSKKLRMSRRSRRSKNNKSRLRLYKGGMSMRGAPPSYVGSIQGEFINSNGQQLFRNPTGGIA